MTRTRHEVLAALDAASVELEHERARLLGVRPTEHDRRLRGLLTVADALTAAREYVLATPALRRAGVEVYDLESKAWESEAEAIGAALAAQGSEYRAWLAEQGRADTPRALVEFLKAKRPNVPSVRDLDPNRYSNEPYSDEPKP